MTLLYAGIDEAGLGPILGPLAIGYSVLRLDDDGDPWKLLSRRVARDPRNSRGRLVVADSKRVFDRSPSGRKRLEATVLVFLAQLRADGRPPLTSSEVLFAKLRPDADVLRRHPWYDRLPRPPFENEPETLELRAELLRREMQRRGCALVDASVRLVPAGELNASYHETENKSRTVWRKTREVLRHVWTTHAENDLRVTVDRQGGRARYGPLLARGFPEAEVVLLSEERGLSTYRIEERAGPRSMYVEFREKGEDHSFSTALASCLAKYSRETVMAAFNSYFSALQPDLRPTAGYTTDGRRWLEDARPALRAAELAEGVLIRER